MQQHSPLHPKGHYSDAVVHGGLAYLSGRLPLHADGMPAADLGFEAQCQLCFDAIDRVLADVGSHRHQLLKVTVYITDVALWPRLNAAYAQWLGEHRPARSVVPVAALHHAVLLEVDAIAAVPTLSNE